MKILIFIISGIAMLIVTTALRKRDKEFTGNIVISIICGIVCTGLGTYSGCADGWASTSIGRQGACSHHGGVQAFLNIYGVLILIVSSLIILLLFARQKK